MNVQTHSDLVFHSNRARHLGTVVPNGVLPSAPLSRRMTRAVAQITEVARGVDQTPTSPSCLKRASCRRVTRREGADTGGWLVAATGGDSPWDDGFGFLGGLLWSLEALLHRTVCARQPSVSAKPSVSEDFSCAGDCPPLSTYSPYFYTFTNPGKSDMRLSSSDVPKDSFGDYPAPVLIRRMSRVPWNFGGGPDVQASSSSLL